MKKLFAQIVKFGIVGFISFGIDYVTGLIVLNLVMALTSSSYFEMASLVGSVAGFTVSVIANYILSFKFVFERKEDLNKKVEFITFVVLSLIGMLLKYPQFRPTWNWAGRYPTLSRSCAEVCSHIATCRTAQRSLRTKFVQLKGLAPR